jgi:hypothetical protein
MTKLPNWKKDSAALEKLFRSLPIQETGETAKLLISGIADHLLLMRPTSSRRSHKIAGTKKALERLARLTHRTISALEGLSRNALERLNYRPERARQNVSQKKRPEHSDPASPLRGLITRLRILEVAANQEVKVDAGRPKQQRSSQAHEVACAVAWHYRRLTGKTSTRYNAEFISLLESVYKIVGIEASATAQAANLTPEQLGKNR